MPAPERPKPEKGRPRLVYPNRSTAQHKEQKAVWKFTKKYQSIFMKQPLMAEGHSSNPQGPYYYQKDGQMYASLPLEMIQNIQQCPHYTQMKKDCKAEGVQLPLNILAQDPRTHVIMLQQYLQHVEAGTMPPMHNHNLLKEMAEKSKMPGDQTRLVMLEFPTFQRPQRPDTLAPQNCK